MGVAGFVNQYSHSKRDVPVCGGISYVYFCLVRASILHQCLSLFIFEHWMCSNIFLSLRNDLGLVLESVGRHEESGVCFVTSLQLESTAPIIPYTTIPRLFHATDYC